MVVVCGIAAAMLAVFGIGNLCIAIKDICVLKKLKRDDTNIATAKITKVVAVKGNADMRSSVRLPSSYTLYYEYQVQGEVFEGTFSIPTNIPTPKKDDELEIEYSNADPKMSLPTQYGKQFRREIVKCFVNMFFTFFFAVGLLLVICFDGIVSKTVVGEKVFDGHRVEVYVLEAGATASTTLNVSFDYEKNSKERGNIFCARIAETPPIEILFEDKKITVITDIDECDIFTKAERVGEYEVEILPMLH